MLGPRGSLELAAGNVVGSNLANLTLVLGAGGIERGHGLTLLGDPAAALAIYAEAAPPAFRSDREQGSFAIIKAQALAHAGHLDEGVIRAIEGLELARSYGSTRHISRVQRMHDRLARTTPATDPRMVELRDALAA